MANELTPEMSKTIIDKAAEFLGKLVNKPLTELGDLWTDNIRLYRFKNQVNIVIKAQKYLEIKGIVPQTIPLKMLAPLLEYSSWEEDHSMQDKWASLLANAANPGIDHDNEQSYVEMLNQLSPLQAKILNLTYGKYLNSPTTDKMAKHYTKDSLVSELNGIKTTTIEISIENLFRLNLFSSPLTRLRAGVEYLKESVPVAVQTKEVFQLSSLGIDFMEHCTLK